MYKQIEVYSCNGYIAMDIFSNKKKQTTDVHNHMDAFQKHYVDQKKPDTICKIPFSVVLGHVGLGCGNGNVLYFD